MVTLGHFCPRNPLYELQPFFCATMCQKFTITKHWSQVHPNVYYLNNKTYEMLRVCGEH
jgi:hypothetical protein